MYFAAVCNERGFSHVVPQIRIPNFQICVLYIYGVKEIIASICMWTSGPMDTLMSIYEQGIEEQMLVSMVKPKGILESGRKCFCSGLHMTLECRDTKFWPNSACITMSLHRRAEPIKQRVCHTGALPFTLKGILRQKKNYENWNILPCKNPLKQTRILQDIITL